MGPTTKIMQFRAEEPEADQSSALCHRILAVLEQHHQETLQRLDKMAAGRRLSHSLGNASLDPALDGANLERHLGGSAEMGNDPFGTHMGLIETPMSPPDNDVPGHGDGMSPDPDHKRQALHTHPGDSIPVHDSIPLWPPDAPSQSETATGIRVKGRTKNIVQLDPDEPEAHQSSVLCRPDMHLDGSTEMGNDLFGTHMGLMETPTSPPDNDVPDHGDGMSPDGDRKRQALCRTRTIVQLDPEEPEADQSSALCRPHMHRHGTMDMGSDLSGMHMGLIETPTSPPDNDVPGHGDGMSPNGELKGVSQQGPRASKAPHEGDGGDSEESDDRRRRLSAALDQPSVGLSSIDTAAVIPAGSWRRRLRKILHSTASEVFIVMTILANSLLIGAEVQFAADYPDVHTQVFINVNIAFTMLFLIELLARTWVDGLRQFWRSKDWAWNMCDLIIVTTSLAEVLTTAWASDSGTPTIMRVFRIARVGKALRIQRLIRFISALRTLVFSIFVTLRSLVWALVLLVMIMYIFGIVIAQFSVEHLHDGMHVHNPQLMKFWGSLWASMLTLFQSITGGISWYEVTDPLQEVSGMLVGVFIMYIFLITFAVFNVITGIFCHSAIETAVRDPDLAAQAEMQNRKLYIQRVKKLFYDVDEDGSGVISLPELESVVKNEHVRAYFAALDLDLSDAWTLFKLIAGKNDEIDQDTFVNGCLRLRGSARRQDCIATMTELDVLLRKFSSFAKITTEKLESLSARGGLPQPQKRDISRISQWSQSLDSETACQGRFHEGL